MIIITGATGGIGEALARALAAKGHGLVLCARDKTQLQILVSDIKARSNTAVHGVLFDATDFGAQEKALDHILTLGEPEGIILAQGYMAAQDGITTTHEDLRRVVDVNLTSAMHLANLYAKKTAQGYICVISSIAGERGKARNLLYNAAKGGLSIYLAGLRQTTKHPVIEIRPGWIDTSMTFSSINSPLVCSRENAAKNIIRAIEKRKRIAYIPEFWRYIMFILRNLPSFIFDRLKL